MNTTLQSELQAKINSFAAEVTALLTKAVAESVGDALGSTKGRSGARSASALSAGKSAPKRGRRSAFDADKLFAEVKRDGGRRMEELARSLRVDTRSLTPSMKKLIADKKVKTKGKARGTSYTVA